MGYSSLNIRAIEEVVFDSCVIVLVLNRIIANSSSKWILKYNSEMHVIQNMYTNEYKERLKSKFSCYCDCAIHSIHGRETNDFD